MNSEATFPRAAVVTSAVRPQRGSSKAKPTGFRQAVQLLVVAGLALASYLFFSQFILQTVQVVGVSMFPTLRDADRCFLNRWAYYLHPPRHHDIIVLKDPTDGVFAVKRVIATPGESVYFKDGSVYLNGKRLQEPYLPSGTVTLTGSKGDEALILCGKDQYFVLGDNRNNSFDSRFYGPVRRQNILGAIVQ